MRNRPTTAGENIAGVLPPPRPGTYTAVVMTASTPASIPAWNAGIWIPALTSLLKGYATYDKLDGYKTDTAKKMVRTTMQTLLEGNAGPIPGWPQNGSRIWAAFNDSYGRIWKGKLAKADIQKELDAMQKIIVGLVAKS